MSAALELDVSPETIQRVTQLAEQVVTTVTEAGRQLDAVLSGHADGDAFGALIGQLDGIAQQAANIPGIGEIVAALEELVGSLPQGLPDVGELANAVEAAIGFLAPVTSQLIDGGLERGIEEAVSRAGDVASGLTRGNDELAEVANELRDALQLLERLAGWQASPPNAHEVAELLAKVLGGVDLDLLDAPAQALETALAPLAGLLPAGPVLTAWRGAPQAQLELWTHVATGPIDWAALERELNAIATTLDELQAARVTLHASVTARLGSLQLSGLDAVASAIAAIPRVNPAQLTPLLDGLRNQLQGMAEDLEAWTPTEQELRQLVREWIESLLAAVEQSPLGQIRDMLLVFEQRMLEAVGQLPFAGVADELSRALLDVGTRLDVVDPAVIRKPIHDFFDELKAGIEEISGPDVQDAVRGLWSSVETATHEAAELLGQLSTAIQGVMTTLQDFAAEVHPVIDPIVVEINGLREPLDAFDLSEAATVVIDALHELRDTVASLDVSSLPGPAVSLVKQGAEALRAVDVTAAVRDPLEQALEVIDPTPALTGVAAQLTVALEPMRALDPQTLVTRLTTPIDELLGKLATADPSQALQHLLDQALEPVLAPLHELDVAALLSPLTRLYADLLAQVDNVLDPHAVLAPLEALFQPILDLVNLLSPDNLLGLITPHVGGIASDVGKAAGPPATIADAGHVLKDAVQDTIAADDLLGFRPGDVLVPLIDLHRRLVAAVEGLDASVLAAAGTAVAEAFHGRLDALDPAAIEARVRAARASAELELDPAAVAARLADAALAHHAAATRVHLAAAGNLSVADREIAARVTVRIDALSPLTLVPDLNAADELFHASAEVDFDGLRTAHAAGAPALAELLATLPRPGTPLLDVLRALDPAPIRDEANAFFDRVGHRIVALQGELTGALEELFLAAEDFMMPLTPGHLLGLASRVHAAVAEQIAAIGPAAFEDELGVVFAAVRRQLSVLDPAVLVGELEGLRDELVDAIRALPGHLLPDAAPLRELQVQLAALKPNQLLAPVLTAAQPISELIATLNPQTLFAPLIEAIARVRGQVPDVVAQIEAAFDEVLAAFPEGGGASVSASASIG